MSKQTVLVIDDERDIRELLTITLGRMELDVDAVGSVSEARSALAARRYDLCFTDMRLPDGSGQEIIELIAAGAPAEEIEAVARRHKLQTVESFRQWRDEHTAS